MALNRMAGRTFNDLSQYPVFPWILNGKQRVSYYFRQKSQLSFFTCFSPQQKIQSKITRVRKLIYLTQEYTAISQNPLVSFQHFDLHGIVTIIWLILNIPSVFVSTRGFESWSTRYAYREISGTREFWFFPRGEVLIWQSLFLSWLGTTFHGPPRTVYKHGNRSPIWKIWLPWPVVFRSKRMLE